MAHQLIASEPMIEVEGTQYWHPDVAMEFNGLSTEAASEHLMELYLAGVQITLVVP